MEEKVELNRVERGGGNIRKRRERIRKKKIKNRQIVKERIKLKRAEE